MTQDDWRTMNTTNWYHHLRGPLQSKPPPWRHRHRPYYPLYLLHVLAHLLPFRHGCITHPSSHYYPPSQHHPNVPPTLTTRSQPNPGLQPHNKSYPLQPPPPFFPPHYLTIPSHQNNLLPTTTSTTHGTHSQHPHRWPTTPHTWEWASFPPRPFIESLFTARVVKSCFCAHYLVWLLSMTLSQGEHE